MQKIKDTLVKRIYKSNLSRCEVLCLLKLIEKSDEKGQAQGIYYKDMADEIGCSTAQYYNVLERLSALQFIKYKKDDFYKADNNVIVLGNDFSHDGYRNYIDTNIELFEKKEFKSLKAGAMRVCLYLIFRIKKQGHKAESPHNEDKNRLFYKQYKATSNEIGITERMLKMYLKELSKKKIVSVGRQIDVNGKRYDVITVLKGVLNVPKHTITEKGRKKEVKKHDMHNHFKHFIKVLCRRYKIQADQLNTENAAILLKQYRKEAEKQGKNIYGIIKNAFEEMKSDILDSRFIHYITKALVNKDYTKGLLLH